MFAHSHSILVEESIQLLNINWVNDVRQTDLHDLHIAEPLVPEPIAFEIEMAIEELKGHKSSGNDEIPAEMIKAGGRTIHSEIHKLVNSIWNKEELPKEWK
jgi:hypothetical protein